MSYKIREVFELFDRPGASDKKLVGYFTEGSVSLKEHIKKGAGGYKKYAITLDSGESFLLVKEEPITINIDLGKIREAIIEGAKKKLSENELDALGLSDKNSCKAHDDCG